MSDNEHLAIASVPVQSWGKIYDENEALSKGTVFYDLNKPFFITAEVEGLVKTKSFRNERKTKSCLLISILIYLAYQKRCLQE